jgi:hypothetical protein
MRRIAFIPATTVSQSLRAERYRGWIAGGTLGLLDLMRTKPRLSGRNWHTEAMNEKHAALRRRRRH